MSVCSPLFYLGTWSLTVMKEHRLMVFQNRAKRMFEYKRKVILGEWIQLHQKFHNSHVAHVTEVGKTCEILVETLEGK
jgi:ribosomal protein L24E